MTDADPGKTPWILVLNYIHRGSTSPTPTVRTTATGLPVLPTDGSLDYDNSNTNVSLATSSYPNGTSVTSSWGHAGNDLFNKVCIALGAVDEDPWNTNGLEVRFRAKSQHHLNREVHFKSSYVKYLQGFRKGDAGTETVSFDSISNYFELYSDHTTYGPQQLPAGTRDGFSKGEGDYSMTRLWNSFDKKIDTDFRLWFIHPDGTRWEVDSYVDGTVGYNYNTYHQIWVRANKADQPNTTSLTNLQIPKVLDITGNVFPSSAVNYANVYLYGTDGVSEKHDDIDSTVVSAQRETVGTIHSIKHENESSTILKSNSQITFTDAFVNTVSVWFKIFDLAGVSSSSDLPLVAFQNGATDHRSVDLYSLSGQHGINIRSGVDCRYNINFEQDVWYNLTCVSSSNTSYSLYINGTLQSRATGSTPLTAGSSVTVSIGGDSTTDAFTVIRNGPAKFFIQSDVVVYNSALTSTQVTKIYDERTYDPSVVGETPVVHYDFSTSSTNDTTVPNLYDNSYNMTLVDALSQASGITIEEEAGGVAYVSDPNPHVQVTDVSEVTANELTISGTVFSSVANIASVKAALFDLRVDLETDTATVATFVGTNGTDLSITSDQYAVGSFTDFAMNSYFSNIVNVDGNLFENSIGDLEMSLDMTNLQNNKIYDLTLNNKDAIVVNNTNGGLIVGNDVDGDYVEFDGTTSSTDSTYIQLDTTLLSVPDFTFDIVFKIKQNHYFSNNNVVYVATSATGANNLFCMRGDPNVGADSTKLRFSFGDTIQYNKAYQWVYPDVLYRHTWVYSNGQISLYVNGEQLGDTTTATFDGQPTHFEINGHSSVDATTGMGKLPMKVYGVNVFNKALDALELASLWDNNNNVSVTNTSTSTPLVDGESYSVVVIATDGTNVGIGAYIYPIPQRPLTAPTITFNHGPWLQNTLVVGRWLFNNNSYYKVTYVHPDFQDAWYYSDKQDIQSGPIGLEFSDRTRVYVVAHGTRVFGSDWSVYDSPIFFGEDQYRSVGGNNIEFSTAGILKYYKDFEPGNYADVLSDVENAYNNFRVWVII